MGRALAVLGTMSSVGKSVLAALISYHLAQKGLKVSPFKAQNMSLNAFATPEGEMAYAQAFQAWAAGRDPSVRMNPLLLKPLGNMTAELIFLGRSQGILPSDKFRQYKAAYKERVFTVFEGLLSENDWVIIEGAGSVAELNLLRDDFVNYELVQRYRIPFILVGDIDRGGIFAQIWGTYELLPEIKDLSIGFVINKFRGAPSLFEEGVRILEEKTGKPCLGLLPYFSESLFEEDSASLGPPRGRFKTQGLRLAVVYYPHISNYLDLDPLRAEKDLEILLTDDPRELERAHVILLPGSKNTLASLYYLRKKGLYEKIRELAKEKIIFGLCGGFQLLGRLIRDEGVENTGEEMGLGLLPHQTIFHPEKIAQGTKLVLEFPFFRGPVSGFEIRYGRSYLKGREVRALHQGLVFGTYLHGVFYQDEFRHAFLSFARRYFGLKECPLVKFKDYLFARLSSFGKQPALIDFLTCLEKTLSL